MYLSSLSFYVLFILLLFPLSLWSIFHLIFFCMTLYYNVVLKVLNRCDDVAPTVRLRALGALSGLLSKLKGKS